MTKQERSHIFAVSNPYNGGRHMDSHGYIKFNFRGDDGVKIKPFEHRLVMENKIGRKLFKIEEIHHINGRKTDNREENLVIMHGRKHKHHHSLTHPWRTGSWT